MKLSEYKYIVTIEKKDFRSRNEEKTTFRRRGFQTFKFAEKFANSFRNSHFVYNVWILNMAQVSAAAYIQQFQEENPREF